MCIMCYLPKGKTLTSEEFENCWESNPHGGGLVTLKGGEFLVVKSMDKDEFKQKALDQINQNKDSRHLIHFRLANVGEKSIDNIHPFKINSSTWMAHNGTITGVGIDHKSKDSDTNQFATLLSRLPWNFLQNKSILALIMDYVGSSNKLCFLTKSNVFIINENAGVVNDGRWFSNNSFSFVRTKSSYKGYTTTPQGNAWMGQTQYNKTSNQCKFCGTTSSPQSFNNSISACYICENIVHELALDHEMSLGEAAEVLLSVLTEKEPTPQLPKGINPIGIKPSHILSDEWRDFIRFTDPSGKMIPTSSIHKASSSTGVLQI